MALGALDDKPTPPKAAELRTMLGRSATLWDRLIAHVEAEFPPLEKSWDFAGAKWGWSLRLRRKKRTVLNKTPATVTSWWDSRWAGEPSRPRSRWRTSPSQD